MSCFYVDYKAICMYPCNIILLFLHILVFHNHTKTHKLLFYLFPVLIGLFMRISVLFISFANIFMISCILHSFSENCIFNQFEKIFFKINFYLFLSSVFISSPFFLALYSYQCMILAKLFD